MNCLDCHRTGTTTPAVALCRSCSAALCDAHLRKTADDLSGRMYATCGHDTWTAERG